MFEDDITADGEDYECPCEQCTGQDSMPSSAFGVYAE